MTQCDNLIVLGLPQRQGHCQHCCIRGIHVFLCIHFIVDLICPPIRVVLGMRVEIFRCFVITKLRSSCNISSHHLAVLTQCSRLAHTVLSLSHCSHAALAFTMRPPGSAALVGSGMTPPSATISSYFALRKGSATAITAAYEAWLL